MNQAVTNKTRMYALLSQGRFGNTVPQFFDVVSWRDSPEYDRFTIWGVRTLTPGGPCRLHCPTDEVPKTAALPEFAAAGVNISPMIDAVCRVTLWADVYDSPTGFLVYGIEYPPPGASWRRLMPTEGRQATGVNAGMILARHLNPNSLADLDALREGYPGHVYEVSACDRCVGTVPGRNTVVWEVRRY